MESNNNIDQFFKDKLKDREFVLEEAFVADLEFKLNKQSKGAFFWYKLILGFIIVAALFFTGLYYLTSDELINTKHSKTINNKNSVLNGKDFGIDDKKDKRIIEKNKEVTLKEDENANTNSNKENLEKEKPIKNPQKIKTTTVTKNKTNKEKPEVIALNKNKTVSSNLRNTKPKTNLKNRAENEEAEKLQTANSLALVADTKIEKNNNNGVKLDQLEKANFKENVKEKADSQNIVLKANKIDDNKIVGTDSAKTIVENNEDLKELTSDSIFEKSTKIAAIDSNDVKLNELEKNSLDANITVGSKHKNDSLNPELRTNEIDTNQILDTDSSKIISDTAVSKATNKKTKDLSKAKKWSIAVFAGPSIINKNVSGNENSLYYTTREDIEKNITVLNYGVELGYFFNKNINVAAGVNALTYGEDIKHTIEETKIEIISVISSYDTVINYDSLLVPIDTVITPNFTDETTSETTSEDASSKNRYTYLQVPFMLGYKKRFNKFGVNVKAGIVYGRLIKSSGGYINENNTAFEPTELKQHVFSFAASTVLSYSVKKFNLLIEPKYQSNLSNVFPKSETTQKYSAFGISFGIGIDF